MTKIKIPSVRTIGRVFGVCYELSDVEFGEALRTLQANAFNCCHKLERIALPLKDDMIEGDVFNKCTRLSNVDLIGGIHNTVV